MSYQSVTSLRIDDLDPADSEALVRMWRASFEFGVGIKDPHPVADQVRFLEQKLLPHYRLRVAWQGCTIVAFLASNAESIAQLYVRIQNIGQGIGTRLVNLAKAESSGSLWLYTFARNSRACRFYERRGFIVIERGFEPMWQLPDVKYRWVSGANVG
jgi:ribosomal protein S18 acetylase RimI-like enzyme